MCIRTFVGVPPGTRRCVGNVEENRQVTFACPNLNADETVVDEGKMTGMGGIPCNELGCPSGGLPDKKGNPSVVLGCKTRAKKNRMFLELVSNGIMEVGLELSFGKGDKLLRKLLNGEPLGGFVKTPNVEGGHHINGDLCIISATRGAIADAGMHEFVGLSPRAI